MKINDKAKIMAPDDEWFGKEGIVSAIMSTDEENLVQITIGAVTRTFPENVLQKQNVPLTSGEANASRGDRLIGDTAPDAHEAFGRLQATRKVLGIWDSEIKSAGIRSMPDELKELYESAKLTMRAIEATEVSLIGAGQ